MQYHRGRPRRRALPISLLRSPAALESASSVALNGFEALASESPFRTIYADPPWESPRRSLLREPRPADDVVLRVDQVANLPVGQVACRSALALLWAPVDLYYGAQEVLAAWGFELRDQLVPHTSAGRYGLAAEEVLLVGTRGDATVDASDWRLTHPTPCDKHGATRARLEDRGPSPRLSLFTEEPWEGWCHWPGTSAAEAAR